MDVAKNWEKKEKVAGLEVEPAYSTSKIGKSTWSIFKDLSEFGLCRRIVRKVHAHFQSLALSCLDSGTVSTQRRFFVRVVPFPQTLQKVCCDLDYFAALKHYLTLTHMLQYYNCGQFKLRFTPGCWPTGSISGDFTRLAVQ